MDRVDIRRLPPAALVLAFLAGCASQPGPLAQLPTHDLDLSVPPRPPVRAAHRPQAPDTYRYAEPRITAAADPWAVARPRQWRYIVIHHSATDHGNAATFDVEHRRRGWDGLGYHFVIDNGHGGPDGRVEVGYRWRSQKCGAHCGKTPNNEYNEYGIGICLVGDFTKTRPTSAQLASLRRLVSYLAARYRIDADNVIGHCDAPNASTECPGSALHQYVTGTLRGELRSRYALRN